MGPQVDTLAHTVSFHPVDRCELGECFNFKTSRKSLLFQRYSLPLFSKLLVGSLTPKNGLDTHSPGGYNFAYLACRQKTYRNKTQERPSSLSFKRI